MPLDHLRTEAGPPIGFRRHLQVEVREGVGAFLFSENGVTSLRGPGVDVVASLLDGSRDIPAIVRDAGDDLGSDTIIRTIESLMDAGLVSHRLAGQRGDERSEAYWDACGLVATETSVHVGVVTAGVEPAGPCRALAAAGLQVKPASTVVPGSELTVVICDDYLNADLATVDAAHRSAGVPWLLAKPEGARIWLGPVFVPGETGCWHCLAVRLWQHRQAEMLAQADLGRSGPASRPVASVPALEAGAYQFVALEATKWLAGHRYPGQRAVWTLDSFDLQGTHHELRQRPQCEVCGDPGLIARATQRPVAVRPSPKASGVGGGHRTLRPDQMLATYQHLISPVTGVVKEIVQDDRGPAMLNCFRAGPNLAAAARGFGAFRKGLRSHSGGKGVNKLDAEVGALCEAIERYSATYQGDEYFVQDSLCSLGSQAIDPRECLLFDERQYAERSKWNAEHGAFQYVFEPFDPQRELAWTPVWSLTHNCRRYLPSALLYSGTPRELSGGMGADSNGNAAGSSITDAILQGALELVERDSVALWWYNRTAMPAVDLDSFDDPWIGALRDTLRELGRDVWVLDITADLDIPSMVAVSRRTSGPDEIIFGCGAHLDPHIALRRALTEVTQMLPAVIDGLPATVDDPDLVQWMRHATVSDQPYVLPDDHQPSHGRESFRYRPTHDIKDDVDAIVSRLSERRLEMLVLDQTRPDVGLPVVKVVVPGLRHFWARLGPGRLFDVPVELGRQATPTDYADLNPIPFFM